MNLFCGMFKYLHVSCIYILFREYDTFMLAYDFYSLVFEEKNIGCEIF